MNECIPRAAHVIPDSGQYYLISADGSGVYERVTRDFIHYSAPRPLIQAADAEGITGCPSKSRAYPLHCMRSRTAAVR